MKKFSTQVHKGKANYSDLAKLIRTALPHQGAIEVQRDVPGKEHTWHHHQVDETIIVIEGALRFYWQEGERVCFPGDVISLPAGSLHGSEALDKGAIYVIAFHAVDLAPLARAA